MRIFCPTFKMPASSENGGEWRDYLEFTNFDDKIHDR
jgi:hypothetical protein